MLSSGHQTLFIVGFLVYIVIMILVGYFSSRGNKSEGENFLTAGKNLNFFLVFATIGATMIGTGSSMGATANGFNFGWGGSIYGIGAALGILTMVLFIGVRKKEFITMSEEAQYYYGGNKLIRSVMGVMMFIVEIIWLGNHMNGGSKYLAYVTGLDPVLAKVITVFAFAVYVFIGGYMAVVWTDAVQFCIIVVGFAFITFKAIPLAGGFENIKATYEAAGNGGAMGFYGLGSYGVLAAFALIFSTYMGVIGTPTHRTRIYTSRDEATAKKAFLSSGVTILAFSIVPSIIGMSAFAIATKNGAAEILQNADYAFSYMVTTALGPIAGLFFLIAGLSATMSSGDSDAISGVTILLTDVYPAITGKTIQEKDYKKYSRISLIVTLLLAFFATLYAKDVIGYINSVVGSLLPGLGVCMFMGRLWKRATWQGGLGCVFGGTAFGLLFLFVKPFADVMNTMFGGPAIPATIISIVIGFAISLATPPCTLSDEERVAMVMAGRQGRFSELVKKAEGADMAGGDSTDR